MCWYRLMHEDILRAVAGDPSAIPPMSHGINVAAACAVAFESAKRHGEWLSLPMWSL